MNRDLEGFTPVQVPRSEVGESDEWGCSDEEQRDGRGFRITARRRQWRHFSVTLPPDLLEGIGQRAHREGVSRSELIRRAVGEFLRG